MKKSITIITLTAGLTMGTAACDQDEPERFGPEPVAATQQDVEIGQDGVGILWSPPRDMPDIGYRTDDVWIYLRSYEPRDCSMPNVVDLLEDTDDFSWSVMLRFTKEQLQVGKIFQFTEAKDCPQCLGPADSAYDCDDPAGLCVEEGHLCGDDSYNLPVVGQVLAVEEGSVTIAIHNLCFYDRGPMNSDLSDDPADDVVHRVHGIFTATYACEGDPGPPAFAP